MQRERILAIEDDEGVCRLLRHTLAREDFDLQIVTTGKTGLSTTRKTMPDLILLDLGLPDMDGIEVCRSLKSDQTTHHLPIIILTGNNKESDVVNGLEAGADDYIIKPVRPRILTARIRAALRRRVEASVSQKISPDLNLGQIMISMQRDVVTLAGNSIDLNQAEFHFIHSLTQVLSSADTDASLELSIGQEGMRLFAENRLVDLTPIFKELLNGSQSHPLLYKFAGLALMHSDAEKAEKLLDQAADLFRKNDNPVATLSILAQQVLFHIFINGNIERATELFRKTEYLENSYFDKLSVFSRISVAQALAIGNLLLCDNLPRGVEYLSIAEALTEDRGLENLRVINLIISAYNAYISADSGKLSRIINETLRLLDHPRISDTNKALLKMAQLVYLSLTGDFPHFRTIEKNLRTEFEARLPPTSLPLRLLTILQFQSAQAEEDHDSISTFAGSGINNSQYPLLTGMFALSAILTDQIEEAKQITAAYFTVDFSIPFFDLQGRLYCIRALLEFDPVKALNELEQVQNSLASTHFKLLEIQALGLSLLFNRDLEMTAQNLTSLKTLFCDMKSTGIKNLQCLTRSDLLFLLQTAAYHNIERLFVTDFSREKLKTCWDRDWNPIPILHFNTLGGLQIYRKDTLLSATEDFSRSQRDCLAVLIASPGNRVDQEEMQLKFWPESPPEKARANLDTMLSRLRKALQTQIKPLPVKNYLKLQKGVVSLEHCSFDINELRYEFTRGRKYLSNQDFWRADIAISNGLRLWNGGFVPGSCFDDQATKIADQIHQECIKTTLLWGETLTGIGQTGRAIRLLKHALTLDRCNEKLIALLHRNYMRSNNITQAALLLRQYEQSLHKDGHTSAEIGQFLSRLRTLIAK
jgi:DNA-binding response OmpR family regulator